MTEVVPPVEGDNAVGKAIEVPSVTPEVVGSIMDAATIVVDGTAMLATSPMQTKVTLVEHFPTSSGLKAKPVVNLVIPNDQFLKILDVFNAVGEKIKEMQALGKE